MTDIFSVGGTPPSVTGTTVTSITQTTAIGGGNVTVIGTPPITRGVVWNTLSNVTGQTGNSVTNITGNTLGVFTTPMTGLTPNTTYYVRAYATGYGTTYADEINFTTLAPEAPTGSTGTTDSTSIILTSVNYGLFLRTGLRGNKETFAAEFAAIEAKDDILTWKIPEDQ